MTTLPQPSAADDDEIDIFKLLGALWRGRLIIVACAILAMFVGGYYAYRVAVPLYPAQATVALLGDQQQVISPDIETIFAAGGSDMISMNTEFQVIRSRRLIGELVDELNLTADPEFNGALRDPSLRTRISRFVRRADPPNLPPEDVMRRRTIDAVSGRIRLSNISQSRAFDISIETTSSMKSTQIINALAELYIANQIQQKLDGAAQAIEFLSRRTTELEQGVERLEQELASRTERSNVVTPELLQARNLQLRDLRDRISELQGRIATDEALAQSLEGDPAVDVLLSRLEGSDDGRLLAIAQRYNANRITEAELRAATSDIVADIRQALDRSIQQLETLQGSESDLSEQVRTQSEDLIVLQQLQREVQSGRLLYETFFNRLQEASVQQGLETADAIVLSEAVPRGASSPKRMRIVTLAAFLGAVLGAGLVMLRELRFSGFRTSDDLRSDTGNRVFGAIPSLGNDDRRGALEHMRSNPNSVFAEAVRNLRTSILMSNIDREPQVIMITSSIPGEGKTTVSIALTRYLASMEGKRALLLEADLRRKTLRAYVDNEPNVSLLDVLLGRASAENIDLFNEELGIEVLAGSDTGSNAADLFSSRRFKDLMEALRQEFDYIVIDTPPVLAVPDARVLSGFADAVVFAVRWGSTTKTQVRQGLEMLGSVGRAPDGMVLTQVDHRKMRSYGYGGQYGYDGYATGYYGAKTS